MRCVSLLVTLVILTMCFAWTANALDKNGLVMYLPMDEGSGRVAKDASGNGNDGELMGNSEWVEGQYGQAVHLNQVSDEWVEVPHSDSLDITGEITLELWAKVVTMGGHCAFISKATDDQTGSYILHVSNDNGFYTTLVVFIGVQGPWPPPAIGTTTIGEWHHFAGTYDGAELSIYIDGELQGQANRASGGDIDHSENTVVIGRDNRSNYWTSRTMDCLLDEVRIWNRVLSQEEIQEAMEGPLLPVNSQDLLTTMWGLVKTEL